MGRLEGMTAVVTGGGRGLGKSVALGFAREGARVVVNDLGTVADGSGRDAQRAQETVDEIVALGGEAVADGGDVADWNDARTMVQTAIDRWTKLDILVNCAAIIRLGTPIDTAPEDFDAITRVNLRGTFNTTHFAALHWVERKEYGRLINFSSGAALVSQPTLLAYSTSKAGILGFTRSCANALVAYNVTANSIRPSAATGMGDVTTPAARKQFEATGHWPRESAGGSERDPEHVVPLIVFLASPAASNVTGRLLEGRGGRYVLWSEPHEERVVEADFLTDPIGVYNGLERELAALTLRNLPLPLPPFEELGDWRAELGVAVPVWDFGG